jgi:CRP/FNR family transcriptional regulator
MRSPNDRYEALKATFQRGRHLTFKKGEFIIRPGDTPPGIFYIESGLIKAYDITKYGEENLLIVRHEGEVFPLIWAVTGQERSVIYQAITPASLFRISRKDFLKEIEHPDNVLAVLDMTIEMYRLHSERIINLEYRSVRERLISFMLTMLTRFGKEHPDGMMIDLPLRQQDIASSINSSRETTSRELSLLEKKGLIKTNPQYVILKDVEKLKSFL